MGELFSGLLTFLILGLSTGAAYAIASSGLVITYATSNVFNMAHGAIGMLMAFVYWWVLEIGPAAGSWVGPWNVFSIVLVVGVVAPLFGAVLERTIMRRLTDASTTVSLTVTVGLLIVVVGIAQVLFPPGSPRVVSDLLPGTGFPLFDVTLSAHRLITLILAAVVAGALYLLLNRTRTGIGMRAIVDNRELLALYGAKPGRLGMLSWAIGASLAALAGILLAPLGLEYFVLTLIVVNAFAAAMLGRLKSLPRTFVGAILLGIVIEEARFLVGYVPDDVPRWVANFFGQLQPALPTLFLLGAMLALPQERLRVGRVAGATLVRLASRRRALLAGLGLIAAVAIVTVPLGPGTTGSVTKGLGLACVMLSLVLLAGYGGDMSLGQLSFAGIGALVIQKWFAGIWAVEGPTGVSYEITLPGILLAGLVAAVFGAIVALPALRLRGLYLGLGTLAIAAAMEVLVFKNPSFGYELGGSRMFVRPEILGMSFRSERAAAVFVAIAFVVLALFVLELRRSRFGRLLLASRDSESACSTLGQSITLTRIITFSIASGIAGIGGVMMGMAQVSMGESDFAMFQNLPLVLLAVIGGITSISGALIGGLLLGVSPVLQDTLGQAGQAAFFLLVGGAAVFLGRNPNGIAGMLFDATRRWRQPATASDPEAVQPLAYGDEFEEEVTPVGAS
jgi:branched-chain amino acid transport system permease protein